MVKLVDTPDLGSGAARRGSSSLSTRTRIFSRGIAADEKTCLAGSDSADLPEEAARCTGIATGPRPERVPATCSIKTNGCQSTAATT